MASSEWPILTVEQLQKEGILLVEDGNHGENRPRPNEFVSEGTVFIRAADIDNGTVLFDKASFINDVARNRIRKGIGAPGDVLLSHKGTVGKVALVREDAPSFVCSPQTTFWRSLNQDVLDRRFLYYHLISDNFRTQLDSRKGETDMAPYVSLTAQRKLTVPLMPIEIQHHIVDVVGSLDDKIELNRQLNATLEQLARTLFQSWFVDFDPVRAKASGELPDSICRRLGLTPELLALFPAALEESVMGEIPAGWAVKPLDEVATFLNGVAAQKYPPTGIDDLPVIKIAQLRKGNTEGANLANGSTVPTAYIVENGDVLFSWSGSLEVEIWGGGLGLLNQHLFKVESEQFPKWFYFIWTRYHLPSFRLIAADKATTMGHIQRKHLTAANVLVPSAMLIEEMTVYFSPILAQMEAFAEESVTLAALRDELLPKLLSGDLRLS